MCWMNPGLGLQMFFERQVARVRSFHTRLTMRRVHFAFMDGERNAEVWYWEDHRGDWWLAIHRFGLRKRWHEPMVDGDGRVTYVDFRARERHSSSDDLPSPDRDPLEGGLPHDA